MTGLETILAEICTEGDAAAAAVLKTAQAQAEALLQTAEQTAQTDSKARAALLAERVKDAQAAGESAAALAKRRALLATKQECIADAILAAKELLKRQSAQDTAALLLRMIAKTAKNDAGELRFSAADLARLPADFSEQLKAVVPNAALTISKAPAPIDGGFLLVTGEIEQNCSFESLFYSAREAMQDAAQRLLFQ